MATILTVYNFKGGVGKTTTTYKLAKQLSHHHKVLVIDFDPQCNLTLLLLRNRTYHDDIYKHIKSYLHHHQTDAKPIALSSSLSIIPGSQNLIELESNNQFIEFGGLILQQMIRQEELQYDFILFDCPSYFGKTVKFILANSDQLLVPMTPDVFSIKGAVKLIKSLKSIQLMRKLTILGAFFNKYRTNSHYHKKIKELASRVFGIIYMPEFIRNSIALNESLVPIYAGKQLAKSSKLDDDFLRLYDAILSRLFEQKSSLQSS
jgi:chromosome partitioning protein